MEITKRVLPHIAWNDRGLHVWQETNSVKHSISCESNIASKTSCYHISIDYLQLGKMPGYYFRFASKYRKVLTMVNLTEHMPVCSSETSLTQKNCTQLTSGKTNFSASYFWRDPLSPLIASANIFISQGRPRLFRDITQSCLMDVNARW